MLATIALFGDLKSALHLPRSTLPHISFLLSVSASKTTVPRYWRPKFALFGDLKSVPHLSRSTLPHISFLLSVSASKTTIPRFWRPLHYSVIWSQLPTSLVPSCHISHFYLVCLRPKLPYHDTGDHCTIRWSEVGSAPPSIHPATYLIST